MNDSTAVEELLNGFLDDELTPRQRTEVERLVANDPKLAQHLDELRKCKELVHSIPTESAPEHLLDDIKIALEKRTLLAGHGEHLEERKGLFHLAFRRTLSAAAVLILLTLLGGVVYKILKPVSPESTPYLANESLSSPTDLESELKFDLVADEDEPLTTDPVVQPVVVAAATEPELVFDLTLHVNGTTAKEYAQKLFTKYDPTVPVPAREINRVICSKSEAALLFADMQELNGELKYIKAHIRKYQDTEAVTIERVSFAQLGTIVSASTATEGISLAKQARMFNEIETNLSGSYFGAVDEPRDLLPIPKPVLASNEMDNVTDDDNQQEVQINIRIKTD